MDIWQSDGPQMEADIEQNHILSLSNSLCIFPVVLCPSILALVLQIGVEFVDDEQ